MSPAAAGLAAALARLTAEPARTPVAGCTDLMVGSAEAASPPGPMLDLLALPELAGIRDLPDGGLEIGATTSFARIGGSQRVRRRYPALAAAARVVGGWQIQNRATLGGNVVNASPAGDSLPVLLALDAEAVALSADGERRIPYARFHSGYRTTALVPGELLGSLRLPPPPAGSRQVFRKVGTREAQAISKVVVAALGRVEDGVFTHLRLAAGSVAAVPVRLTEVEREVVGRDADQATAARAGRLAAEAVEPIDDVRSTAEYRRFVLGRVVARLIRGLAGREPERQEPGR